MKCDSFYLATEDGDMPRVRRFCAINIFENKLYIQAGKTKSSRIFNRIFRMIGRNDE